MAYVILTLFVGTLVALSHALVFNFLLMLAFGNFGHAEFGYFDLLPAVLAVAVIYELLTLKINITATRR